MGKATDQAEHGSHNDAPGSPAKLVVQIDSQDDRGDQLQPNLSQSKVAADFPRVRRSLVHGKPSPRLESSARSDSSAWCWPCPGFVRPRKRKSTRNSWNFSQ